MVAISIDRSSFGAVPSISISATDNTKMRLTFNTAGTAAGAVTYPLQNLPIRPLTTAATAPKIRYTTSGMTGGAVAQTDLIVAASITVQSTNRANGGGTVYVYPTTAASIDAAGTNIAYLTVIAVDAFGYPYTNTQINLSAGIGGFGTAGTANASATTSATTGANTGSFIYRGKGVTGVDTIVATAQGKTSVTPGTYQVTLGAASGTTAVKTTVVNVQNTAVAADQNLVTPNYKSPLLSTDIVLSVTDSSGNGVNGQLLLASVNKGAIKAGAGQCVANTTTATTAVSNATATDAQGNIGRATMSFCGVGNSKNTVMPEPGF